MKLSLSLLILILFSKTQAQLTFCDESIPTHQSVRYKLSKAEDKVYIHYFKNKDINRIKKYVDYFEVALENASIPTDFKYLPVVESALNNVISHAGAAGYWQIMPGTGRDLDLAVQSNYDERFNVIKSTTAAIRYLRWLYNKLNNWTLVAAAYNCGAGNVNKAIRKSGHSNYYFLPLPSETKEYVYKIIAVKKIYEQYFNEPGELIDRIIHKTEGKKDNNILTNEFKKIDSVEIKTEKVFTVKAEVLENKIITTTEDVAIMFTEDVIDLGIEKRNEFIGTVKISDTGMSVEFKLLNGQILSTELLSINKNRLINNNRIWANRPYLIKFKISV